MNKQYHWTSEVVGFRPASADGSGYNVVRVGSIRGNHAASCVESLDGLFRMTGEVLGRGELAMLEVDEAEGKAGGGGVNSDTNTATATTAATMSTGGEDGGESVGQGEKQRERQDGNIARTSVSENSAAFTGRGREYALDM
ncbi:hypothetical protein AA313_de0209834 [Arthrobotrys entomopaga]|nr:hypothetical protein AA313_de0209834 [Arthrobotrys entomopaga]